MRSNRNLLVVLAGLTAAFAVVWFAAAIPGKERTYEVEPWITTPDYQTDTARTIDAYERLMERYVDLTETHLSALKTDFQSLAGKLDSIDSRLAELSAGLARVELKLGVVDLNVPPLAATADVNNAPKTAPRNH